MKKINKYINYKLYIYGEKNSKICSEKNKNKIFWRENTKNNTICSWKRKKVNKKGKDIEKKYKNFLVDKLTEFLYNA